MNEQILKSFTSEIEKEAGFFGRVFKSRIADPAKEYAERAVSESIKKHKGSIEKEVRKNIRKLMGPAAAVGLASGATAGGISYLAGRKSRKNLEEKLDKLLEQRKRR